MLKQDDFYQIMSMKLPKDRWNDCGRTSANMFEIHKLLPDAKYKFRVRVSNDQTGLNGHFSPESDVIETPESLAETLRKKAKLVDKKDKNIYRLNIKENTKAKNKYLKLKKFTLGKYLIFVIHVQSIVICFIFSLLRRIVIIDRKFVQIILIYINPS